MTPVVASSATSQRRPAQMSYLKHPRQQERRPDSLKAQSERFVAPTTDTEHHMVTPVKQLHRLVRKGTINTFFFCLSVNLYNEGQ